MTDRYALFGSPIDRSPSPAMHNAAFEALGIDATYGLRPAVVEDAQAVVAEVRDGTWRGANVTIPLKRAVAERVERRGHALRAGADFYSNVGFTKIHTFGQDPTIGNGPYGLAVGESMTFVFVLASGYRFEGIADAMQAAEWAWERGWDVSGDLPVPPAPDLRVESTTNGTALIQGQPDPGH